MERRRVQQEEGMDSWVRPGERKRMSNKCDEQSSNVDVMLGSATRGRSAPQVISTTPIFSFK